MFSLEKNPMPGKKDSNRSLKKKFNKILDAVWKIGNPLPEEPLPELPKIPLTKEQIDSTRDPLDVLSDKIANEKPGSKDK